MHFPLEWQDWRNLISNDVFVAVYYVNEDVELINVID